MIRRAVPIIVVAIGLTGRGLAQGPGQPGDRQRSTNRFSRGRERTSPRRSTTQRAFPNATRQKQLFDEANAQAIKLQRGWAMHARTAQQGIESLWVRENMNTEADQFIKKIAIECITRPPNDFYGRLNAVSALLKDRYTLTDAQVKRIQGLAIRRCFEVFMRHSEALLPISREIIDTRVAGKPFTPDQVQRWTQAGRPIAKQLTDMIRRDIGDFSEKYMTPEQRTKLNSDMAILDKRVTRVFEVAQTEWETGKWSPEMWGLESDPVHVAMQARMAETERQRSLENGKKPKTLKEDGIAKAKAKDFAQQTDQGVPPPVSIGPPRVGDTRGRTVKVVRQPQQSSLPDETQWVAYVKQFCERYDLNKAQRAAAFAILQDLQGQAQSYRSSRVDEIKQLQEMVKKADTSEERRQAQAELRAVLGGIDELFQELKTRLQNIPTGDQLRRAG